MAAIDLRHHLENGDRLYAHCLNVRGQLHDPPFSRPPCTHGATLDLAWLLAKVGRDVVDLYGPEVQRMLVCKRCGCRGATLISSPPDWSQSSGGREARGGADLSGKAPPASRR